MILVSKPIDPDFLDAVKGLPDDWAIRAIAGYTMRTLLDDLAADDRFNDRERANRHGLSRANTDDEREAWTFGFTWPDRRLH